MSRYQWPAGKRKSKDLLFRRMQWNLLTDGVLLEDAVAAARSKRGSPAMLGATPRMAPSGDVDLWTPIGPSTVLLGQASSKPRVAGRVRDLAVSPDGTRAYAATANGGVWFTSDAGGTWSPVGNWLATPGAAGVGQSTHALVCGCILVIFGGAADGSADTVYVGTGELLPRVSGLPGAHFAGVGVLKLNKPLPDALADPYAQHWDREAPELTGFGIYRLAHQPGTPNVLVAATSVGLYSRSAAGAWSRVNVAPFDFGIDAGKVVSDAAWADLGGGNHRLWVALRDGSNTAVHTSTSGAAGPFQRVALPNVVAHGRLGLAVASSDPNVVYVLGAGPRLWRITGTTPSNVENLPNNLFMSASDQSSYDLAVAVHPDNKDVVFAGGATIKADGVWSASLYKFTIANVGGTLSAGFLAANQGATAANDATFIGNGVHADVHQIRSMKSGAAVHVWVGCDGGVYRSEDEGNRHSFLAKNASLAVLETGFVSSHPENEAFVIAGTQDNGTLLRVGDTLWLWSDSNGGDGGSVLMHPVKQRFFVGQYTSAAWYSNGSFSQPVLRGINNASESDENGRASFYSAGDICRVGATNQVRVAIGTHRVWVTDNWDPEAGPTAWFTLPSGTDPRATASPSVATDVYGGGTGEAISCRFASDDRVVALVQSARATGEDTAVLLFTRSAAGAWQRKAISEHANKKSRYADSDIPTPTSTYLPPLGSWSDIAVHDPTRGADGSYYVACTGHVVRDGANLIESAHMDTLWWYDGSGTWHPTGLRNNAKGTKAPAYAVLVDAVTRDTVYVATALGVWRGTLSFAGTVPKWDWQSLSNGLPEAPVHDLSMFHNGSTKLLRAAIQARGVWELDLSTPLTQLRRTYLRVHANDARRSATVSLTNPMRVGPVDWPWHASPDIRLRPAKLAAGEAVPRPPAGSALPWTGSAPSAYWLWVFQTALHKVDPLVRTNGRWSEHFRARLIAHDAAKGNTIDDARWTAVVTEPNVFTTPWDDRGAAADTGPVVEPTEADLFELIVEDPPVAGGAMAGPPEIGRVTARPYKVDVQVHYRELRPLAGVDVRVALLRRDLPGDGAQWPTLAIEPALKTLIEQLMSGSPPAGWSLPAPWALAEPAVHTKNLTAPIEARLPRIVTFETTFSGAAPNQHILLLAILASTPDPVTAASLTGTNLKDLIQTCHHVAARVVETR